ncbi:sulfite exporter TauE/SafE family protein [Allofrancisella frigidaquae]|uniref:Probable membrane transporter protein n=1 Tax=Allofrancisella frigidaquae TaxID=1085644 RepID=A0A6M3HTY0_9GAMM|nr:sulfite exporter TauE/SafE family protein [Allofrancisella frigidaquae]QIV94655.1 sulfite exporter TauE/SafE family protein [Allofrancisella frigidaquae]
MISHITFSMIIMIFLAVFLAYIVFGMTGFGTSLIASPILIYFLPLSAIIPILALLDLTASYRLIKGNIQKADRKILVRLLPMILIGSIMGGVALLTIDVSILMLLLAIFIVLYSLYSLLKVNIKYNPDNRNLVYLFGVLGGVLGTLFGSGGFIYAIFLSNSLNDKAKIRTNQSCLIAFSTLTRAILFLLSGVYLNLSILIIALSLVPVMVIGVLIGNKLYSLIPVKFFKILINVLVLVSGITLLIHCLYILC